MALTARLQVRQTQSLIITPQLMQAIRLLQMSSLELEHFVAAELEQNPLLEEDSSADADRALGGDSGDSGASEAAGASDPSEEIDAEPAGLNRGPVGPASGPGGAPSGRAGGSADWDELGLDRNPAAPNSLEVELERRIEAAFQNAPADRAIALVFLARLDDAGYLTDTVESVAGQLGADVAAAAAVLARCQALAPTGIFARSLSECLALQLAEQNRLDPAMQVLLDNLDRLAAGDRAGLCLLCGVDRDDLDDMIAEIRALDPKPGLAFDRQPVRALVPDVFVRPASDGGWTVELNDALLPRILINRSYFAKVSRRCAGEAEKRYLADCLQKANWLEKSLDQRARTVLRVASEIVRRQEGFLADGAAFLKPLNLRMVADALGIHESTVSRAAANKTIATPRGIFEFRYFFTGSIPATSGGEAHSAEAVKHRIRKMILAESPGAVLSDDTIVAILARDGIDIARRTVAKYRELMHIGSSVERRRLRRLKAVS